MAYKTLPPPTTPRFKAPQFGVCFHICIEFVTTLYFGFFVLSFRMKRRYGITSRFYYSLLFFFARISGVDNEEKGIIEGGKWGGGGGGGERV